MHLFIKVISISLALYQLGYGKIIYVDDDASAGGDGSSWDTAFNDLQNAFDTSSSGDEIWIAAGVYTKENGYIIKDINDRESLHIFGGFVRGESSKTSREYRVNKTIVSGDLLQNDEEDWSGRSENTMLLDLENLSNVYFDGIDFISGVGLYQGGVGDRKAAITADSSSLVFHKCIFYRNGYSTGDPMGVMSAINSSVDFVNCIFAENTGGIFHGKATTTTSGNGYLSVNFKNDVFYENKRSSLGALVWITGVSGTASANARLTYSTIVGDHKFFSSPFASTYGDANVFYATDTFYNSDPNEQGIDSETTPSIFSNFEFVNIDIPKGRDGTWGTVDDGIRVVYDASHKINSEKHYDSLDLDQDGIRTEATPFNIYGTSSSLTPIKMIGAYDLSSTDSTDVIRYSVELLVGQGGQVIGGGIFEDGESVTIQATANSGYIFQGWSGDITGEGNPISFIVDSNKNITASFSFDTNDSDGDGLTNYQEVVTFNTNPEQEDSDGDGFNDYDEVQRGLNPNLSDKALIDAVMELKSMKAENVTPYTDGWFYSPSIGWLFTNRNTYPYIYDHNSSDWMYFQSGNENPRFYKYKTNEWISLD